MRFLNRKRLALVAVLAAASVAVALLTGSGAGAASTYNISYLTASNVIPGWHGYDVGAKEEAAKLGVNLTVTQWASLSPSDLVAGINAVVAAHPDAAIFSAVNGPAEQSAILNASKKLKVIVGFDSPCVSACGEKTYVGSNAAAEGTTTADVLAKLVHYKGTVLETDAAPSFGTLELNMRAFRKEMAKYKNITLLPLQYDAGDTSKNAAIVRATLARYPNLAGAYLGTSGLGGEGGVSALRAAGKIPQVKVVTLDGLPAAISDLKNGYQQANISVKLEDLGGGAVKSAVAALKGQSLPATIHVGYCVLTKANVSLPQNQQCIYVKSSAVPKK
jgi:ABC-type sugar transport system substrate-binding protein